MLQLLVHCNRILLQLSHFRSPIQLIFKHIMSNRIACSLFRNKRIGIVVFILGTVIVDSQLYTQCDTNTSVNVHIPADTSRKVPTALQNKLKYQIHQANDTEIKAAASLIVNCFCCQKQQNEIESEVTTFNDIDSVVNNIARYRDIVLMYFGLLERVGKRRDRDLKISNNSVLLVATSLNTDTDEMEVKGVAELSLELVNGRQPKDNHRGFPFRRTVPLDELKTDVYQPYLSNLCVDAEHRQSGLGQLLCERAGEIARECWGKHKMFLHVEHSNSQALRLYGRMGFAAVHVLDEKEVRRLKMENILHLQRDTSKVPTTDRPENLCRCRV